jgi:hypothetical protein
MKRINLPALTAGNHNRAEFFIFFSPAELPANHFLIEHELKNSTSATEMTVSGTHVLRLPPLVPLIQTEALVCRGIECRSTRGKICSGQPDTVSRSAINWVDPGLLTVQIKGGSHGQAGSVIRCPVRTAIGTYRGSLKEVPAPILGATVIRESVKRSGLAPDQVRSVVMGNVIQAGAKINPARQAGIGAGLPVQVPALTVNRVCGSGAQAIASAALEIWTSMIDCAVAGGVENMDRAPYLVPAGWWGARMGDVAMSDGMLTDGLNDAFSGQHSGCAIAAGSVERGACDGPGKADRAHPVGGATVRRNGKTGASRD